MSYKGIKYHLKSLTSLLHESCYVVIYLRTRLLRHPVPTALHVFTLFVLDPLFTRRNPKSPELPGNNRAVPEERSRASS